MPNIIWKQISGYEGCYEVSNNGSVRGIDRIVHRNTSPRFVRGVEIKPRITNSGYCQVILRKNGKQKPFYVHRLVAEAFLGKHDHLEVNHIDEDKTNNNLSNLEWVTRSENLRHNNGGQRRVLGRMKPVIAYDETTVTRYASVSEAARALNVSPSNISRCCRHVKNQRKVHGIEVMFADEWSLAPLKAPAKRRAKGGGDA